MNNELKEEWREYNGYQVSNYGKVVNKHGKTLKRNTNNGGYTNTKIIDYDGTNIRGMHRIVATVFISNPNKLPEVNHLDGKKENNRVDNLEWCTKSENQQHEARVLQQKCGENNYHNKLTDEQVLEIYNLCKNPNIKRKDIAKMYNIIPTAVSSIARGLQWKYLNLEPLPNLTRGSKSRGKKVFWINQNKEYSSIVKCYEDMKNTYNLIISDNMIKRICNGEKEDCKGQKFRWVS